VLDRRLAGWSLIVGPVLTVLGNALHPSREKDEAEHLANVASNSDRWVASHLLFVAALIVGVGVLLGLAQLLRARPRLAQLGGGLGLVGLVTVTPIVAFELVIWEMAKPEFDREQMATLLERANESAALAPLYLGSLAFPAGITVLAIGLWRTGVVPGWQGLAMSAGQWVFFIGGLAVTSTLVPLVGAIAFLAGTAPLGRRLLSAPAAGAEREDVARVAGRDMSGGLTP
jgi:hypothetical protein